MKVLSIGEVLWDVFPDREFLGGAPLNVCANLNRFGDQALLLSAVGEDAHGHAALQAMEALGLTTELMQTVPALPTGTATVGQDAKGEPVFTIRRPAAFDGFELTPALFSSLQRQAFDWLYMGTLLQTDPAMERLVDELKARLPDTRCFYDMNLRQGHWNLPLVERLCRSASILKLNEAEAETLSGVAQGEFSLENFCSMWAARFKIEVICVTLGAEGCCVYAQGKMERFAGRHIRVADTVGAGDAFAAAFLHGYHQGWSMERCAALANTLGALVASRSGATPVWQVAEIEAFTS